MFVSICPTFKCNQNCNYCYLGNLKYNDSILNLNNLENNLQQISKYQKIDAIDIFGGEISLLTDDYLIKLKEICKKYTDNINITTNLFRDISNIFNNISVSLNIERKDYNFILEQIKKNSKKYSIISVILPSIINKFDDNNEIYDFFNFVQNYCKSLYFVEYSPSIYSLENINIKQIDFDNVLIKAILAYKKYNFSFSFINLNQLLDKSYSPCLNTNIFILPNGQYSWIDHKNNLEFFNSSNNFNDYIDATNLEYNIYIKKCSTCEYFNNCYTEHLNFNIACSGHKTLLNWLKNENNIFKIN